MWYFIRMVMYNIKLALCRVDLPNWHMRVSLGVSHANWRKIGIYTLWISRLWPHMTVDYYLGKFNSHLLWFLYACQWNIAKILLNYYLYLSMGLHNFDSIPIDYNFCLINCFVILLMKNVWHCNRYFVVVVVDVSFTTFILC